MFDTLFGYEMPLALKFFVAFVVVLCLILGFAWAVRRFGAGRLGTSSRGRQPRLAVVDYASVDGRRRLILVRRDNVEHLLMIGGPSDVVVEPNIVRALTATRDAPGTRPPVGLDTLPRAIPLPENGTNGSWPLQPEAAPRPAPRIEPLPDELPPRPLPPFVEPAPRPQRDTLAALADELSTRPAAPPRGRPPTRPHSEEPSAEIFKEPQNEAYTDFETLAETHPEPRAETRAEPRLEPRKPVGQPAAAAPHSPPVSAPEATEPASAADQSLADMAQRLEAALRKPIAETRPAAPPARSTPLGEPAAAVPPPPPPRARDLTSSAELPPPAETGFVKAGTGFVKAGPKAPRPELRPEPRPESKPSQSKTTLYDSLEQEMASLLGRQNKT